MSSWCLSQQPTSCFWLHTTNQNKAQMLSVSSNSVRLIPRKQREYRKSSERKVTDAHSANLTFSSGRKHEAHGGEADAVERDAGCDGVCSESWFILSCWNVYLKVLRVAFTSINHINTKKEKHEIKCLTVCSKNFHLYWSRTSAGVSILWLSK